MFSSFIKTVTASTTPINQTNSMGSDDDNLFLGRYQLVKSENFDAFLYELGIGYIKRKLAQSVTPEIEVTKDGEYWTALTKTLVKNTVTRFKLGEEFEELRQDDVMCKSMMRKEGNKWIQTQTSPDGITATIIREFGEKELRTTCQCGSASSLRVYKRISENES